MTTLSRTRPTTLRALALGCGLVWSGPSLARQTEWSNRVVVVIDGSGSYRARQAEAVERTEALLGQMARTKLHRWDTGLDRITVIALDAVPEVLWEGTLRDLQQDGPEAWTARFAARSDWAGCTDVTGAFRLAASYLEGDSRYVGKYLFAFTDLVHEPPTTRTRRCSPPHTPSLPGEDFPWEALEQVSVSVFWVPPDQKLAWKREVEARGMASSFLLYSTSESGEVAVAEPPRKTVERTDAERAEVRGKAAGAFAWLGKAACLVAAVALLAVVASAVFQGRRQPAAPRGRGGRPAGRGGRVPPLPPHRLRPAAGGRPPTLRA